MDWLLKFFGFKETQENKSLCLTQYEKIEIVKWYFSDKRPTQIEISKRYGVSTSTISLLIKKFKETGEV